MKIIVASDIHGSAYWCEKLLNAYSIENAGKLLLLGDILYHGPRNPLPDGYSPKSVVEMLGPLKDEIICVRGNCDSEVDQMVLPFNISSDYATVYSDGLTLHLSHGHRAEPPMGKAEVYLTGHTHVPLKEKGAFIHLNPGSVSLPKENSRHGYILIDGKNFYFKDFDGNIYDELKI